jgi:hypothetical protein
MPLLEVIARLAAEFGAAAVRAWLVRGTEGTPHAERVRDVMGTASPTDAVRDAIDRDLERACVELDGCPPTKPDGEP